MLFEYVQIISTREDESLSIEALGEIAKQLAFNYNFMILTRKFKEFQELQKLKESSHSLPQCLSCNLMLIVSINREHFPLMQLLHNMTTQLAKVQNCTNKQSCKLVNMNLQSNRKLQSSQNMVRISFKKKYLTHSVIQIQKNEHTLVYQVSVSNQQDGSKDDVQDNHQHPNFN
ncbi:unnamed protein product [Paramecium octaurelia]|uniref:Uncharacterized protein n=1 Tax=Paramecium octaurelia TaxID=43137 RepID=A0A8S1WP94_PAROT|nr:unnamed protein product [Paramecium octaurelia]